MLDPVQVNGYGSSLRPVNDSEGRPADSSPVHLTPREIEVLRLMADGSTTKAIAYELKIRYKTAVCHRSRILEKLCVSSTVSAVRWAIREGLVIP